MTQDGAYRSPPGYAPLPSQYQPLYPAPPITVHTTVAVQSFMPPPAVIVIDHAPSGPNILVRLIWFLFIGLWLGSIVTVLGYALCLTILFLPVGLMLLNHLPAIMTLRPPATRSQVTTTGATTVVHLSMRAEQRSFLARALYFLLIGWWAGGLWLALAWLLVAIWPVTLGISLAPAFLMFDRLPAVMTLRRT